MSKHTPGPWEAYFTVGAGWRVRKKEVRAPICSMAWFQFPIPGIIDEEISEANARLIAAAPDLLNACKNFLNMLPHSTVSKGMRAVAGLVAMAVAKADEAYEAECKAKL